jgi:hypothetical protein
MNVSGSNFSLSERRKYVDYILKEELGPLYIGVPSLYKVFFREVEGLKEVSAAVFKKCKEGDNLLHAKGGWRDWPRRSGNETNPQLHLYG